MAPNSEQSETLLNICPLDGRYSKQTRDLARIVSEAALIRYRLRVEAAWTLHLEGEESLGGAFRLDEPSRAVLRELAGPSHGEEDLLRHARGVKAHEAVTNHDVKAVEYHIRDLLRDAGGDPKVLPWIHFACTSEDINNVAYALMLEDARRLVLLPEWRRVVDDCAAKASRWADVAMVARTHGQLASPTTLGKEIAVFGARLHKACVSLAAVRLEAKFNGAVGNFNAHRVAFPRVDWDSLTKRFLATLGLRQNSHTTQIDSHDTLVEYLDALRRVHTIALDLARDTWGYVSLGYLKQRAVAGETGSSTMPHKVNPIDFENAEGNLGIAIALAQHMAEKLPVSRWQRDLSDSTVLRSLGTLFGHSLLSCRSLSRGLSKIEADDVLMRGELAEAYEVLGEAAQTLLRRYGASDAYERLKDLTRGKKLTCERWREVVGSLDLLPPNERERLMLLTPESYVGDAARLAREFAQGRRKE
jgi:adenylosuccinate lyase